MNRESIVFIFPSKHYHLQTLSVVGSDGQHESYVKVLDVDSISQAKQKILDAAYRRRHIVKQKRARDFDLRKLLTIKYLSSTRKHTLGGIGDYHCIRGNILRRFNRFKFMYRLTDSSSANCKIYVFLPIPIGTVVFFQIHIAPLMIAYGSECYIKIKLQKRFTNVCALLLVIKRGNSSEVVFIRLSCNSFFAILNN